VSTRPTKLLRKKIRKKNVHTRSREKKNDAMLLKRNRWWNKSERWSQLNKNNNNTPSDPIYKKKLAF
jgi:hypothetical protein